VEFEGTEVTEATDLKNGATELTETTKKKERSVDTPEVSR